MECVRPGLARPKWRCYRDGQAFLVEGLVYLIAYLPGKGEPDAAQIFTLYLLGVDTEAFSAEQEPGVMFFLYIWMVETWLFERRWGSGSGMHALHMSAHGVALALALASGQSITAPPDVPYLGSS